MTPCSFAMQSWIVILITMVSCFGKISQGVSHVLRYVIPDQWVLARHWALLDHSDNPGLGFSREIRLLASALAMQQRICSRTSKTSGILYYYDIIHETAMVEFVLPFLACQSQWNNATCTCMQRFVSHPRFQEIVSSSPSFFLPLSQRELEGVMFEWLRWWPG